MFNFVADIRFRILSFLVAFFIVFSSSDTRLFGVFNSLRETVQISAEAPEQRAKKIVDLLLKNDRDTFEDETCKIANELVYAVAIQFLTGSDDQLAMGKALARLPHSDIVREEGRTYGDIFSNEFNSWIASLFRGSPLPDDISGFFAMLCEGINDLYVYLDDTEYDGIYEFKGSFVTNDGEIVTVVTGAYYDSATGVVYGKDQNGIFGIGYDFDAKRYVVQNPINVWMRSFGYNIAYDILGNMIFMDSDTVRIKFNCNGKDWMFQFWKGNYTHLSNGAEMGIYYLKDGNRLQYSCAEFEDMLEMRFDLLENGNSILSQQWQEHWWLSGFKLGPAVDKDSLTLDCGIRFEDEAMRDAFVKAAQETGEVKLTVEGLQVNIIW